MQLEHRCSPCHGTGTTVTTDPWENPTSIPCPYCGAKGYVTEDILFPEYELLAASISETKDIANKNLEVVLKILEVVSKG
jgi:excinuclease UvrABC ATPase subunit